MTARPLPELPAAWRDRAAQLERYAPEVAVAMRDCAEELERELAAGAAELLTLTEASRRSGYTADHLGALIRRGKLRNHGRRGRPLVRASELPQKPGADPLPPTPALGIVATADRRGIARSVLSGSGRSRGRTDAEAR